MTHRRCRLAFVGKRLDLGGSGARIAHVELGRALAARGHEVRFAARKGGVLTPFGDRVEVGRLAEVAKWADAVFVRDELRLGKVLNAVRSARRLIYTVHSPDGAPAGRGVVLPDDATVVWSSAATKADAERLFGPQPGVVAEGYPVDLARYRTAPGGHVTLVNLSARKGGPLFWQLAERLPDIPFLGVKQWGVQVVPEPAPPNVRVIESQSDARMVFAQTRILLVPSANVGTVPEQPGEIRHWAECWNRVSVEAAVSGIPVIAHPAAGVCSSIADAALYADRNEVGAWADLIGRLIADPEFYDARRRASLARVREIAEARQSLLAQFEELIWV